MEASDLSECCKYKSFKEKVVSRFWPAVLAGKVVHRGPKAAAAARS
jgi:hypothetical protein